MFDRRLQVGTEMDTKVRRYKLVSVLGLGSWRQEPDPTWPRTGSSKYRSWVKTLKDQQKRKFPSIKLNIGQLYPGCFKESVSNVTEISCISRYLIHIVWIATYGLYNIQPLQSAKVKCKIWNKKKIKIWLILSYLCYTLIHFALLPYMHIWAFWKCKT